MKSRKRTPQIDAWGIADGFRGAGEVWYDAPAESVAAIRAAMREEQGGGKPDRPGPLFVNQGESFEMGNGSRLVLEDGGVVEGGRSSPDDLPLGYHDLFAADGESPQRVIVVPPACFLRAGLREWGWGVQLYALHSQQSWGLGDLGDLRRLAEWSRSLGAGFLLINPLGADAPLPPQQASPYSPGSRCFRNLLYLRIEDVPGAEAGSQVVESAIRAGRALSGGARIDRDRVLSLKRSALDAIWGRVGSDPDFESYLLAEGPPLECFSRYCALAETFGRDWRTWPAEFRSPDSPDVAVFAAKHSSRVRFFGWVQWLLDRQLAEAARGIRLMQDFPIGVAPDGADAWMFQDCLAEGVSVGAPPDPFNRAGQNWGLPAFTPQRLRRANYEPFIQSIRSSLRYGALRIDHVMGLFRLFWIPQGCGPVAGAYVYYPARELLGILALESHRAKSYVVGEDLGTVDPEVRAELAARRILSYRVMWFETGAPQTFPPNSLASVGTHDLPTIAGLWTGQDALDERQAGIVSGESGWTKVRDRLSNQIGLPLDATVEDVIRETHRCLARAPSLVQAASLEDALACPHRPNMPGTTDTWPNWSVPLPASLEDLESAPLPREIAKVLCDRARDETKSEISED